MHRNDYFYVLHHNLDGRETTAREFENRTIGVSLEFAADGVRTGSHTLKRFANVAGRPGELLETFLAATGDWVTNQPGQRVVRTIKVKRKRPD